VKLTHIAAGKYKVDGHSAGPLSESARARITAQVEATYDRMTKDIGLGRGIAPALVRSSYGEGAIVNATDALASGMIDRLESLDDTIARVLTSAPPSLTLRADTAQEREHATAQDRPSRQWEHTIERAFLDWSLT
jgi:ClpP class serine protease